MQVIKNDQVYMFDVDDTLIIWDDQCLKPGNDKVEIVDPYDNAVVFVKPHVRHIKLLTQMKGRGRFIVVWSQSGNLWAEAVVRALNLSDMVDLVLTKPMGYVDDLPIEAWLKNHIYLKPEGGQL